jgi:N-acetylglutamate synthase/N-acetylornithine aminotransferase
VQGLAKSIAWDGEGATCLMEVSVTGAKSDADARTAAKSVAGSSLVKSAIFGHDPNWGRIAAAAGYSGKGLVLVRLQWHTCLLLAALSTTSHASGGARVPQPWTSW